MILHQAFVFEKVFSCANGPLWFRHPYCTQVFGEHTLDGAWKRDACKFIPCNDKSLAEYSAQVIPRNILARDIDESSWLVDSY